MNPDDVFAIIERFDFVMRNYPRDVLRGDIRQRKKASESGSYHTDDLEELKKITIPDTEDDIDSGIDESTYYSMMGSIKDPQVRLNEAMDNELSGDDDDNELDEIRHRLGHGTTGWIKGQKEKARRARLYDNEQREIMLKKTEETIKRRQGRIWEKKDKDLSYFKQHRELVSTEKRHSSHFHNPSFVLQFEKDVYTISSAIYAIKKNVYV
jgi:hypothetical protein